MRPLTRNVLAGALVGAVAACSHGSADRRNVIALIDYSGSISGDQAQRYARVVVRDVFENLGEHDAIAVYPIDAAAVTNRVQLVGLDLQRTTFAKLSDGVTHREDSVRARVAIFLRDAADSVFHAVETARSERKRYAGSTDLLGALRGVSNQIENPAEPGPVASVLNNLLGKRSTRVTNVILICSDMLNESEDGDFDARPPVGAEADSLIRRLRTAGKLPDLTGTTVFVTGRTGRNARHVDATAAFWKLYFQETGADLKAYDFDASSQIARFFTRL